MQEKEFTLNNALLVWWFIAWRGVLVMLLVNLILVGGVRLLGFSSESIVATLVGWLAIIIGIFVQVFLIRMAVNRDYTSQTNGSFRLAALEATDTAVGQEVPTAPEGQTQQPS